MGKPLTNFAFIDGQNLHLSIKGLGWKLNYRRFRKYLGEKYGIAKAFMFIGYNSDYFELYAFLQRVGYICVFKPTLKYKDGSIKGNCDAELVLHTMIEFANFDRAVIVTGDGDFYCLVKYLADKGKLEALLIPDRLKYSALLKISIFGPYLRFMNDLSDKLAYIKKRPHKDGTL